MVKNYNRKGSKDMYPNLKAEIARRGVTMTEVANEIGVAPSTFSLKFTGKTKWFFWECVAIKKALGIEMPLEVLFKEQK